MNSVAIRHLFSCAGCILVGLQCFAADSSTEVQYVREPKQGEVVHIRNLAARRPAEAKLRERVVKGLAAVSPFSVMEAPIEPRDVGLVAQGFLSAHAFAFGIQASDLEEVGRTKDQVGMTHLRFRQVYRGVPVYGVDVVAHVGRNNEVTSVHGRPARLAELTTVPQLSEQQAQMIALAAWQAENQQKEPAPTKVYGLYIFAPEALGLSAAGSKPALVCVVDVVPECCGRDLLATRFLVDTETATVHHRIERRERVAQLLDQRARDAEGDGDLDEPRPAG